MLMVQMNYFQYYHKLGFIDNDNHAIDLQKKLSVGQMIVNKQGQIWRWDGFISEDNLQKKKIIDSYLRVTKLRENKKLQKELSNFEKIKKSKVEEEDNITNKVTLKR